MSTVSSESKVAYIYNEPTDTWHPIAGAASQSADYTWTGDHIFSQSVTSQDVFLAKAGINNFQNESARDAAITSPTNGIVCFVRQSSSGENINQLQFYSNGVWRPISDSVVFLPKTADYTITRQDSGKLINVDSANIVTITIPANSSQPFDIGQKIEVLRSGLGIVQFIPASGVTLDSKNSNRKIAAQHSAAVLIKKGTDSWTLIGDLTA